jgi:hypothetical protein
MRYLLSRSPQNGRHAPAGSWGGTLGYTRVMPEAFELCEQREGDKDPSAGVVHPGS